MFARFGWNNSTKLVGTSLDPHFKLSAFKCPSSDDDKRHMEDVSYTNVVGSVMYAMVCTQLDLSNAVSMVSHYMHNSSKEHLQAIKWILCYILGSMALVSS